MDDRWLLDGLVGVYVATLIVTASALLQWESVAADFSPAVATGLGVAIAAVVALVSRTVDDLVERAASVPAAIGLVGLPLAYFPYLVFATDPGSGARTVAVVGLLAIVPGVAALTGGSIIRNRRLYAASTELVTVTVGDADDDGRVHWARALGAAAIGIAMVGVAFLALAGFDWSGSLFTSLGAIASTLLLLGDEGSTLTLTDDGIRINHWFVRWESFDGYRLSDETVELVRPAWYHQTRAFKREEISDEKTLIEGLAEFLPRVDESGEVVGAEPDASTVK
ncbi:MAG: hypothetical protein ACOC0Z_07780 [Halohasta sp.]